jgi:adenylate kinase family enzyme
MRRVVIYGSGGSGKSTLAADLAERLEVAHIEIDTLAFDGRYSHVSQEVLRRRFASAVATDGWVVEGMHRDQLLEALQVADTFVWLDLSVAVVAWRLVRRNAVLVIGRAQRHGRRLTLGELVRDELPFVRKTIRKHGDRRAHASRFARDASAGGLRVVHLRTPADVRVFLSSWSC